MANSVVFLTLLLLSSGSALAQTLADPECYDVARSFLPCMNFLQGLDPNPSSSCCDQLDDINKIAKQRNGPHRICKCVHDLVQETGKLIIRSNDEALSSKCGVRRDFPNGGDCMAID